MRRRDFIKKSVAGSVMIGANGCSYFGKRRIELKPDMQDFSFDVTHPKPRGGTMPYGEIGKTGIKVSKFGYGSHIHKDLLKYEKERQVMIREAYDLGINFFDVADDPDYIQYEPMGKHLAPMINNVVVSIRNYRFSEGRTCEQDTERALRLFGRDYIDMVRFKSLSPQSPDWREWETLFRLKDKGYIRAVGLPIHFEKDLEIILQEYPIDYVFVPFNFYHNYLWNGMSAGDMRPVVQILRDKNIGIITMKPLCSDFIVKPLLKVAKEIDKSNKISFSQAALRYIINSGLNPDATLNGMFNLDHVYENVMAFYNPEMTDEEKKLLDKLIKITKISAQAWIPDHYRFLETWVPDSPVSGEFNNTI